MRPIESAVAQSLRAPAAFACASSSDTTRSDCGVSAARASRKSPRASAPARGLCRHTASSQRCPVLHGRDVSGDAAAAQRLDERLRGERASAYHRLHRSDVLAVDTRATPTGGESGRPRRRRHRRATGSTRPVRRGRRSSSPSSSATGRDAPGRRARARRVWSRAASSFPSLRSWVPRSRLSSNSDRASWPDAPGPVAVAAMSDTPRNRA